MAERVRTSKAALWRAIRAMCVSCCGGQLHEVRVCTSTDCPLHPYRAGARGYPESFKKSTTQACNFASDSGDPPGGSILQPTPGTAP